MIQLPNIPIDNDKKGAGWFFGGCKRSTMSRIGFVILSADAATLTPVHAPSEAWFSLAILTYYNFVTDEEPASRPMNAVLTLCI